MPFAASALTLDTVGTCIAHDDHWPVQVILEKLPMQRGPKPRGQLHLSEQKLKDPEAASNFAKELDNTDIPSWSTPVDEHYRL